MLNDYNQKTLILMWKRFLWNHFSCDETIQLNPFSAYAIISYLDNGSFSLLPHVIVHSTSLSRMIFDQIYAFGVAVVERFTAIAIVFTIAIAELFLFPFGGCQLRRVSLAPFRSTILEPNLSKQRERNEKLVKINHKKSRCVILSKSLNKSLNRAFIWNGLFSIFHCHLTWCWERREKVSRRGGFG